MDLNTIAKIVHENAVAHGFHSINTSEDRFVEQTCNNLHDEISELHEAWRKGNLRQACDKSEKMNQLGLAQMTCLEEELADIIIRALDTAVRLEVDIEAAVLNKHKYNVTRPYRHGDKKS